MMQRGPKRTRNFLTICRNDSAIENEPVEAEAHNIVLRRMHTTVNHDIPFQKKVLEKLTNACSYHQDTTDTIFGA